MSGKSFYILAISFFIGVAISSLAERGGVVTWFLFGVGVSLYLYSLINKASVLLCIAFLMCVAGFVRMEISKSGEHILDSYIGRKIELVGNICEAPGTKETSLRFCFEPKGGGDRMLVVSDPYPEFMYGDELRIWGKLELPKNFESYEGGPEFDYISYLAKDGVRYVIYRPRIEKIGKGGNFIKKTLIAWKKSFVERIESLFSEPESSLLSGILIGEKGSLPKDVVDDFKVSGLQHILVLSGYNVTIVAESFMKAFSFMPLGLGRSFGAVSIVFFALFTGASATTIRASIMAIIVLLSRSTARIYDISRALVMAAFFMVLHNPMILMFDVSFQLSFIATLGLIYVAPLINDRLGWVTEKMNMREILSSSIGTQILVVPFLMHVMGSVSLISLITNLFVLPTIPFSMLFGFIAVSTSLLSDSLATMLSWIAQLPLTYILLVANVSAKIPFASINITMSAFALIVSYIFIIWLLVIAWKKKNSSPQSPN
jgi:competence protein ComEC